MKRIATQFAYVSLVAVAILFTACSKDGATGPAGEKGDQGAPGPGGPAGPPGPAGSVNVIYSAWLNVTFQVDKDATTGDTLGYYGTVAAPKLTKDILNMGEARMYVNLNLPSAPAIQPLPYFDPFVGISISVTFEEGSIFLYSNIDASSYLDQGVNLLQYRYILIPGGTAARKAGIDWRNYKAVQEYLGLKD